MLQLELILQLLSYDFPVFKGMALWSNTVLCFIWVWLKSDSLKGKACLSIQSSTHQDPLSCYRECVIQIICNINDDFGGIIAWYNLFNSLVYIKKKLVSVVCQVWIDRKCFAQLNLILSLTRLAFNLQGTINNDPE